MAQTLFFILFGFAIFAGFLAVNLRLHPNEPSVFTKVMKASGLSTKNSSNKKSIQRFTVDIRQGITNIREEMEAMKERQQQFLANMGEQQRLMEDQSRNVQALMSEINRHPELNMDFMHMKDLAANLENQRQLMTARGQELETLNENFQNNAANFKQQMDMTKVGNDMSQDMASGRMELFMSNIDSLRQQQSNMLDKSQQSVVENQQLAEDLKQKLTDISSHRMAMSGTQDTILNSLEQQADTKQNEILQKLQDQKQKLDEARLQMRERMAMNQSRLKDLVEQNEIKAQDARQRAMDQQQLMQDRETVLMQRMRDQAAARNKD